MYQVQEARARGAAEQEQDRQMAMARGRRPDLSARGVPLQVSYEARARGVTRSFRGRTALVVCPELVLVQVPTAHGKSDMGVYRDFGAQALRIIQAPSAPARAPSALPRAPCPGTRQAVCRPGRAGRVGLNTLAMLTSISTRSRRAALAHLLLHSATHPSPANVRIYPFEMVVVVMRA